MQNDERLSKRVIWEAAVAAVDAAAPKTRTQIADELGVSPGALSHAVGRPNTRFLQLQRRIIEHLTDFRVEGPIYVAVRKEQREAG